jgi:hypothetical protein
MASLTQQQLPSTLLSIILPPGRHHLPALRAVFCSFAETVRRQTTQTCANSFDTCVATRPKHTPFGSAPALYIHNFLASRGTTTRPPSDSISLDSVPWPSTLLCNFPPNLQPTRCPLHMPAPNPEALQPKDAGPTLDLRTCQAPAAILVDKTLVLTSYRPCSQLCERLPDAPLHSNHLLLPAPPSPHHMPTMSRAHLLIGSLMRCSCHPTPTSSLPWPPCRGTSYRFLVQLVPTIRYAEDSRDG